MAPDTVTRVDNESRSGEAGVQSDSVEPDGESDSPRLLTDGGEEEEEEEQEEQEEENDDETEESVDTDEENEEAVEPDDGEEEDSDDEEEEEDEEAEEEDEGEVDDEDRDAAVSDEGTRVLHLNLDGLFLDLLGLEVDLNEIRLNITAIPGDGKLVGNLLSAVSGLIDSSPASMLNSIKESLFGLFGSDGDEEGEGKTSRISDALSSVGERVRNAFMNAIQQLPLEEILAGVIRELVSQLLDKPKSALEDDGEEEDSSEDDEGDAESGDEE